MRSIPGIVALAVIIVLMLAVMAGRDKMTTALSGQIATSTTSAVHTAHR